MMWDSDGGNGISVPEHQSRVEREREIACYLLMVSHSNIAASPLYEVSMCYTAPA